MPSRLTRGSQQAASAAAGRNEQVLVILARVAGATGVLIILIIYESMDAGSQTLSLWCGTALAAHASVQQRNESVWCQRRERENCTGVQQRN